MYQSHESYSACGLNSEGPDLLVKLVRAAGPGQGLYGAKITGGGSGGTVAVLGQRTAVQPSQGWPKNTNARLVTNHMSSQVRRMAAPRSVI